MSNSALFTTTAFVYYSKSHLINMTVACCKFWSVHVVTRNGDHVKTSVKVGVAI